MRSRKTKYVLLGILAAVALAVGFVGARFWRLARQARRLQLVLREAARHPGAFAASPAHKQFSPGFLQMAFGDNPPLLAEVTRLVADAQERDPNLGKQTVTLMLVTYRQEGNAVREVAMRLVGVPGLEEKVATATAEQGPTEQAAKQVYQMGKSLVGVLGNNVRILASPAVEQREQALTDAVINNQERVVEEYLREPLRLVAVMPDPDPLVGGSARSPLIAVLLKGQISVDGGSGELVALSVEPRWARGFVSFLTDSRMLAGGLLRVKFGHGPTELLVRPVSQAEIVMEGPSVIVRTKVSQELMELGLPRFVKGLSKALRQRESGS